MERAGHSQCRSLLQLNTARTIYVLVHTDTSNYNRMFLDFRAAALETGSLLLYRVIQHQGQGGKDINLMVCSLRRNVDCTTLISMSLVFFSSFRSINPPTDRPPYRIFQCVVRRV